MIASLKSAQLFSIIFLDSFFLHFLLLHDILGLAINSYLQFSTNDTMMLNDFLLKFYGSVFVMFSQLVG